jgi:penicillin-binding protein 1B
MARSRKRRRKKPRSAWLSRLVLLLLVAAVAALAWLAWPFWQASDQFAALPVKQPSRLYGERTTLVAGRSGKVGHLVEELEAMGYRRVGQPDPARGQYFLAPGRLTVHLRSFPTPWGWNSGGLVRTRWSGERLTQLTWRGEEVERIALEPPLLFSYYGPDRQERRPVTLQELPETLVQAVLAAEDDRFFQHQGLSFRGIARAAWANLRQGGIEQGGSTLTQQLAKNLFLSHERTLIRKLREVGLAVMIDWRYEKEEILSAYLNEIYWGSSNGVSLMGVGAAAWAYFGKEASQLDLCESAVLAGMISSPGGYSPVTKPERSQVRRDWVLDRMQTLHWLGPEEAAKAKADALCVAPAPVNLQVAPYFGDRVTQEAAARFGIGDLDDAGYVLLSTISLRDQLAAEASVAWGLNLLEKGWEKDAKAAGPLQAGLVSIDPGTGAIRSYIGGRDYRQSQFDRVAQAHRQAGSAFKPVVYATAFEARRAAPSTMLEDAPLSVTLAGQTWSPENSDDQFRGWVSARTALEKSLNVPTARVALDVGLEKIVEQARAMGIESDLQPYPALALGAFEVTPLELASAYSVLAAEGVRRQAFGLRGVLDPMGQPIEGRELLAPERVLSAQTSYLVTSLLQGVLDRGTAASVRQQGLADPLAGKTGTTNDRRDSWFAGYSPERVSLVWVGYDDNSATRLSGSRAALPIWANFTWKVRPAGGYTVFVQPAGVTSAVIDPQTGLLATDNCPEVLTEVFIEGTVPVAICRAHGGWIAEAALPAAELRKDEGRGPLGWIKKIFRRDKPKTDRPRPE